jgi:hypothetical protein
LAVEYFCAYHSYLDALEPLTDAERGRLFVACLKYSKSGEVGHLSGNERFVFPVFRGQIDRDNAKYARKCKKQADNANKRWNKDDANDAMAYDGIPNVPPHRKDANDAKTKEKEKEKEKENIEHPTDACAELPGSSTPPAITLPLADGSEFPILYALVVDLSGLYPAVDVMQQLRNMRGWLLSNPKNRKTKSGIMRFVNSWLAREQNSARPVGGASGGKPTKAQELDAFYGMAAKWANEEGTA